jgi:hypothetical protein
VFSGDSWPDTVPAWVELYFWFEVTTSERSQKEQRRYFQLFTDFMVSEAGSDERMQWTPRLSRAFVEALRSEVKEKGGKALVGSDHQSDRGAPEDLQQMDPQTPAVSPGKPHGKAQKPGRHRRART